MSLSIIPYPIDTAMAAAVADGPGVAYAVKYIRVGKGLQSINLDDAGRATTRELREPIAYLEILHADKVSPYQWQVTINVKDAYTGTDFNFSEFSLCDADRQPVAIYGSATQGLYAVTEVLDNALLAVNLVFAAFPADSINIIHKNLPLKLFMTQEIAAMDVAVGRMTLAQMEDYNRRRDEELQTLADRKKWELEQLELQKQQALQTQGILDEFRLLIDQHKAGQQSFNITTEQSVGGLSLALMQS